MVTLPPLFSQKPQERVLTCACVACSHSKYQDKVHSIVSFLQRPVAQTWCRQHVESVYDFTLPVHCLPLNISTRQIAAKDSAIHLSAEARGPAFHPLYDYAIVSYEQSRMGSQAHHCADVSVICKAEVQAGGPARGICHRLSVRFLLLPPPSSCQSFLRYIRAQARVNRL